MIYENIFINIMSQQMNTSSDVSDIFENLSVDDETIINQWIKADIVLQLIDLDKFPINLIKVVLNKRHLEGKKPYSSFAHLYEAVIDHRDKAISREKKRSDHIHEDGSPGEFTLILNKKCKLCLKRAMKKINTINMNSELNRIISFEESYFYSLDLLTMAKSGLYHPSGDRDGAVQCNFCGVFYINDWKNIIDQHGLACCNEKFSEDNIPYREEMSTQEKMQFLNENYYA